MIIMALDPAQLRDWSALAVVDMQIRQDGQKIHATYNLIALGRKQGLPYDEIVKWTYGTWRRPEFNTREPPEFVLDSTGVGIAVRDMLKAKGMPRVRAVTITAGEALTRVDTIIHLGKARLIGTFLAAFDSGKVRINPSMPIWPALQQELLNYRAEISAQGRAKFEAAEGEHDDMLFALALAVWYGEEIKRGNRL